jgi:hypothetical protein
MNKVLEKFAPVTTCLSLIKSVNFTREMAIIILIKKYLFFISTVILLAQLNLANAASKTITPFEEKTSLSTQYQLNVKKFNVGFHKELATQESVGPFDLISQNHLVLVSRCGKVDFIEVNDSGLTVLNHQLLPSSNNETFCKSDNSTGLDNLISGIRQVAFDEKSKVFYVFKTVATNKHRQCNSIPSTKYFTLNKNKCVGIAVDAYTLKPNTFKLKFMRTVFESTLRPLKSTSWTQVGGGMTLNGKGDLFFAIGDFGLTGVGPDVSKMDNAFGKVLKYSPENQKVEIFASGNRNPAGLYFDKDILYGIDHGPKGGDEVNIINKGDDLGWPASSYGTEYDNDLFGESIRNSNHSTGKKPIFAYLPDIGINTMSVIPQASNLLSWRGDLIIGGINTPEIKRLRLSGDRVIYSESIPVYTNRLRYLKISPSGTIYALSDEGTLTVITKAKK